MRIQAPSCAGHEQSQLINTGSCAGTLRMSEHDEGKIRARESDGALGGPLNRCGFIGAGDI